jgi:alpha-galactosidase
MKQLISVFAIIILMASGCKNQQVAQSVVCAKPPMGFNSYDSYGVFLNQETAKKIMGNMAQKYKPYGYEYFVMDAGWYYEFDVDPATKLPQHPLHSVPVLSNLDEYGLPEPSKVYFPDGIKVLADYAHVRGLKFGLHLMRGVFRQAVKENCKIKGTNILLKDIVDTLNICSWSDLCYGVDMKKPGAYKYYESMVDKMASWGVDFIKYDDITGFPEEIDAIVDAINRCKQKIVLSLSAGLDAKIENLSCYQNSNMLRITDDIWDNQHSIDMSFVAMKKYQGRGIPGFWPDLDMIALGPLEVNDLNREIGPTKKGARSSLFDKNQAQTFITQRAIFASPLIIGGDLLTMDDFTYKLLTNKDMITCNQNGVTGLQVYDQDSLEIYKAPLRNKVTEGWLAVFNRKSTEAKVTLKKQNFGFYYPRPGLDELMNWKDYKLRDIWNQEEYILKDAVDFTIPANGVVFIEYKEL